MALSVDKCDFGVGDNFVLVRSASEDYSEEASEALRAGKVIAVPTDTLYGFACDAWYDFDYQQLLCFFFDLKVYVQITEWIFIGIWFNIWFYI